MSCHHKLIALLICIGLPSAVCGSSACVQEKNHLFASAKYSYYSSENIWNMHSEIKPAHDDFNMNMGEAYFEVGLTELDTISLALGWARIFETLNGAIYGFSDMELGWKRHIGDWNSHVIAAELDAFIPIDAFYEPGIRYGVYGAAFSLLASKGFYLWDKYAWYDLRLGYLWYSKFPSDQILADAAINYHPIPKLFFQLGTYLEYGILNGNSRNDRSLFIFNPNFRLLRGKIEATYCLCKGISIVGGYDRFLWGRNVGAGGLFYCGLQYQH